MHDRWQTYETAEGILRMENTYSIYLFFPLEIEMKESERVGMGDRMSELMFWHRTMSFLFRFPLFLSLISNRPRTPARRRRLNLHFFIFY